MRQIKLKIFIALLTFIFGLAVWSFIQRPSMFPRLNFLSARLHQTEEIEEYVVYSALLQHSFVEDDVKLLAISEKTIANGILGSLQEANLEERVLKMRKSYPFIDEDTLRDFEAKNIQTSKISPALHLPVSYVLVDEADLIDSILDEVGFDEGGLNQDGVARAKKEGKYFLHEKYPDIRGVIRLSRVGFNKGRTEAFVSVEFTYCPLCGSGDLVLLEKRSGNWTVKMVFNRWVS